jgi:hypothetical protein
LTFFTGNCWSVHFSAIFAGAAFVTGYIFNLSASIVGALCCDMEILVAVTTYQPNECTFVADEY